MNLNELRPAEGSKRERRRIGRGHGTGWGKTAGKGICPPSNAAET